MPSVSGAQHRFMAKAMTDPAFAKAHGIARATAAEFVTADKGRIAKLPEKVKSDGKGAPPARPWGMLAP